MKIKAILLNNIFMLMLASLTSCQIINESSTNESTLSAESTESLTDNDNKDIVDYTIDQSQWEQTVSLNNITNATIDIAYINADLKTIYTIKFDYNNCLLKFKQEGSSYEGLQYYEAIDYKTINSYSRTYHSDEIIDGVFSSMNTLLSNEEQCRAYLLDLVLTIIFPDKESFLLKEHFSVAEFDGVDYIIDGKKLPYYIHSQDEYNINNAIIKYHFENKQLVSVSYKENEIEKFELKISNIGTTKNNFDTSGYCTHKNVVPYEHTTTPNNNNYQLVKCNDCENIAAIAHTYVNDVCTICEHKLEIIDRSAYEIEYLNFEGYPKDRILLFKNKETKEVEDIQFYGFTLSRSSENPAGYYSSYGYNAYVDIDEITLDGKEMIKYLFYTYDQKELLKEIVISKK